MRWANSYMPVFNRWSNCSQAIDRSVIRKPKQKRIAQLWLGSYFKFFSESTTSNASLHFVETYRGRLGMQGTSVIKGTRYAWNIDNKGDQVCLERWSQ
jgi:hypothetical protein